MRPVDSTDIAFIKEVYPAWGVSEIAEKLGLSGREVKSSIRALGMTSRGELKIKCPRLDWPSIWYAYTRNGSIKETAMATGYKYDSVRYAIESMMNMSAYRKSLFWNRYAHKNNRDGYEDEEFSVIV